MTRPAQNKSHKPSSEGAPGSGSHRVAAPSASPESSSFKVDRAPHSSRLDAARTDAHCQLKAGNDGSLVAVTKSLAGVWSSTTPSERKEALLAPGREWSQLLTTLAERAVAEVSSLSTSDLASLTSDFVTLGIRNLAFFRAASTRVESQVENFPMKDLAHILRSFAELRVNDAHVFSKVVRRLESEPRNLDSETLVNLAVALALPGTRHSVVGEFGVEKGQQTSISREEGGMLVDLAISALDSNEPLPPRVVCDLVAALAGRGVQSRELMAAVVAQGSAIFQSLNRTQLLSLAESCGALGGRYHDVEPQRFLQSLFAALAGDAESFSAADAVRFFCSADKLRMKISAPGDSGEKDPLALPFERVASRALELRDSLGAAQLAALVASFRRCGFDPNGALASLQPRIREVLSTATDHELSSISFVYSRSEPKPYAFISELATAALNRPWNDIEAFTSFVASCAHIGLKHTDLFRMFPQIVLKHDLDRCDSRIVARLLCAYVGLGEAIAEGGRMATYFDAYFFELVVNRLRPSLSELTSINLSNVARAVVECSEKTDFGGNPVERRAQSVKVITGIAEEVVNRLTHRSPVGVPPREWDVSCQSIAVVTRALGMLDLNDPSILKVFCEDIISRIPAFKTQELCKIVTALARLRYRDLNVFQPIAHEAHERFQQLLSNEEAASCEKSLAQDVCMVVWANANIHIPNDPLCHVAVKLCAQYPKRWQLRDRIQLAWSLAILKPELVRQVCTRNDLELVSDPVQWRQVYHALLAGGEISYEEHFEMLDHLRQMPDALASSRFEEQVFDELTDKIGIPSDRIQRHAFIAAIPVDMAIGHLLIECDGDKWHYSEGRHGDALMGSDFLQDRILTGAGYRVVHIRNEQFHSKRAQALEPLLNELQKVI